MKFSYNWIRELVPGLETDPRELMRRITMKTAECEGLEHVGAEATIGLLSLKPRVTESSALSAARPIATLGC